MKTVILSGWHHYQLSKTVTHIEIKGDSHESPGQKLTLLNTFHEAVDSLPTQKAFVPHL